MQIQALTAIAILIIASYFDIRYRRIPNWLSLALLIITATSITSENALNGILILLFALGVGFALFSLKVVGGGDAKLMIALSPIMSNFESPFVSLLLLIVIATAIMVGFLIVTNMHKIAKNETRAGILIVLLNSISPALFAAGIFQLFQENIMLTTGALGVSLLIKIHWAISAAIFLAAIIVMQAKVIELSTAFALTLAIAFLLNTYIFISITAARENERKKLFFAPFIAVAFTLQFLIEALNLLGRVLH